MSLVGTRIWVVPFRSYDYPDASGPQAEQERKSHVCTDADQLVTNNIIRIDGRMHYIAQPPESVE